MKPQGLSSTSLAEEISLGEFEGGGRCGGNRRANLPTGASLQAPPATSPFPRVFQRTPLWVPTPTSQILPEPALRPCLGLLLLPGLPAEPRLPSSCPFHLKCFCSSPLAFLILSPPARPLWDVLASPRTQDFVFPSCSTFHRWCRLCVINNFWADATACRHLIPLLGFPAIVLEMQMRGPGGPCPGELPA